MCNSPDRSGNSCVLNETSVKLTFLWLHRVPQSISQSTTELKFFSVLLRVNSVYLCATMNYIVSGRSYYVPPYGLRYN
jgi:hypothetical protein